jgi:methylenetetrahydrofolate/methylenetetrahydromethanopterin dehydrogenase (NADP+)
MRKLLLQLDSSRLPSVFDRVVAYDAGADEVMSYGGVIREDVRDLIHGAIFTRGPKQLNNTAVFVGGADMAAGEVLLGAARKALFGPFSISMMLDSNGSNTTAVAAVVKIVQAVGDVRGRRVLVTAGTGPVGARAAGLLARAGADVTITSRHAEEGDRVSRHTAERFSGRIHAVEMTSKDQAAHILEGAEILLNTGPAGVQLVPREAWVGRGIRVAVDLNAVPPLGIEGIEANDDAVEREGTIVFGALGVGNFKMKVHKACVARLFTRNDLVLDAETIEDVAKELIAATG